jgi:hypothetical protein
MNSIGIGIEDYGKDEEYRGQQQKLAETSVDPGRRQDGHDGPVTLPLTSTDVATCSCRPV